MRTLKKCKQCKGKQLVRDEERDTLVPCQACGDWEAVEFCEIERGDEDGERDDRLWARAAYACGRCGSLVLDVKRHVEWHESVE